MLTAKSIAAIMNMRASFARAGGPIPEGSCFGVTDPSRLRDTQNEENQRYQRRHVRIVGKASPPIVRCENPFCQRELSHEERIDSLGTRIPMGGGTWIRACYACYEMFMREPF
jgi:hypothetical protein